MFAAVAEVVFTVTLGYEDGRFGFDEIIPTEPAFTAALI